MFDTSADIGWKSGASAIDIRAKMIVEEFRWSYECLWRKSGPSDMGIRAKMIDGVHKKWWAGYELIRELMGCVCMGVKIAVETPTLLGVDPETFQHYGNGLVYEGKSGTPAQMCEAVTMHVRRWTSCWYCWMLWIIKVFCQSWGITQDIPIQILKMIEVL
jgi:hypothetical protein